MTPPNVLARSGKCYLIEMPEKPNKEDRRYGDCYSRGINCHRITDCYGHCAHAKEMFDDDMVEYHESLDLAIAEALESEFEDQDTVDGLIRQWRIDSGLVIPCMSIPDGTYHVDLPRWGKVRQYSEPSDFPAKWQDGEGRYEHPKELFRRTIVRFIK